MVPESLAPVVPGTPFLAGAHLLEGVHVAVAGDVRLGQIAGLQQPGNQMSGMFKLQGCGVDALAERTCQAHRHDAVVTVLR